MRYEIRNELVTFYIDNPKRKAESTRNQSFAGSSLSTQQVIPLLDSLLKKFRGKAPATQNSVTDSFLRPFFAYFRTTGCTWPTTSTEWQLTVYRYFQFYLTDTGWSKAKTNQRMRVWQTKVGGLLEFLVEDEIIPIDVIIPKVNKKSLHSLAQDQKLLGHPRSEVVDVTTQPQKLLVDISFEMTDVDYLDSVEKKLRHLIGVIQETCLEHWDALKHDREAGRRLAEQVRDEDIEQAIAIGRYATPRPIGGPPTLCASPGHPQGIYWALAIVRKLLANGKDIGCISVGELRRSPFFPGRLFTCNKNHASYLALEELTAMKREQFRMLPIPARFYRFAGLLSNLDVAAACCLLTIEHPEFTSDMLQSAKLLDVTGKPYLLLTDSDKYSVLSLDKPRAGRRKSVILTPLSQRLVMDIIQCTAPVRAVLRRAGNKTWRYLFLGVRQSDGANGFLGIVESASSSYLTGICGSISLTKLYPALSQNGLNAGSFDFRRLRNTQGVLRWFETGSIVEMSRRLGNSRKVTLEHYLPPALLHAWNTRIIRRFQNTLIILAAHDEPYLLDVTDFSNMADLQHFISQLIMDHPPRTSSLADEVQRRLGSERQREAASLALTPGLLNIRLSPRSLGLLYSYSDLALRTLDPDELDKVDVLSGLAPRQFTDMAALFRHAVESNKIHEALSESLDMPLLKQVHGEALAIKLSLDAQLARLVTKCRWEENL